MEMRRLLVAFWTLLTVSLPVHGQDAESIIARITGVADVAELDADEYEHWERLLSHPVDVNLLSENRLAATRLFSAFQIASILDYRQNAGDILSLTELAQLDGFSPERAELLRPFLRFDGGRIQAEDRSLHGEWISQAVGSASIRDGPAWQGEGLHWKTKARIRVGERWSAAWSPSGTWHLSVSGVRNPWRLVIGDFRVRTGQGLLLWKGFSISGLTAMGSFAKTSSGLTPTASWSTGTAFRGLAGECRIGRWKALAFVSGVTGEEPLITGGHLLRLFRSGQLGLTAYRQEKTPPRGKKPARDGEVKCSADAFWSLGRVELFGEAAWDLLPRKGAAVGGVRLPLGERMRLAAALRYYPAGYQAPHAGALRAATKTGDERGVSLGWEYGSEKRVRLSGVEGFGNSVQRTRLLLTLDAFSSPSTPGNGQVKALVRYDGQLSGSWALQLRLTHRSRWKEAYSARNEVRADLVWDIGCLNHVTRADLVRGEGVAGLLYDEWNYGGKGPWRVSLRGTLFAVDRWNDRIYAYEKDAPGGFSVPAFYGRGWKLSLLSGWKTAIPRTRIRAAFYLRGALTSYPASWALPAAERKMPKAQAKAQLCLTF